MYFAGFLVERTNGEGFNVQDLAFKVACMQTSSHQLSVIEIFDQYKCKICISQLLSLKALFPVQGFNDWIAKNWSLSNPAVVLGNGKENITFKTKKRLQMKAFKVRKKNRQNNEKISMITIYSEIKISLASFLNTNLLSFVSQTFFKGKNFGSLYSKK